ncbi:MAG TPA: helix-hairpin-helix domain-containing protein, partial [Pyrinomonadaceae bacterium]|nr:helix-hairpin-helix domain-containing protein [Pyrinomonadaceae bacterium]
KFLASPTTKLILVLLSFAALVLSSSCAKRQRESSLSNQLTTRTASQNQATSEIGAVPRTNINTASATELEKLPGIGKALAERIVEHREKYGPFRRPEHLITVRGISDHRFRALRDLITVE